MTISVLIPDDHAEVRVGLEMIVRMATCNHAMEAALTIPDTILVEFLRQFQSKDCQP